MKRSPSCAGLLVLCTLLLSAISCVSRPWNNQTPKTNLVFELRRGQPVVRAAIGGVEGNFVVGSAHPRTLVRQPGSNGVVSLGSRTTVRVEPRHTPLRTDADGILAIDVWRQTGTLAIDYARGVITLGGETSYGDASPERFETLPAVSIDVEGFPLRAIVDTSYPGGLLLPVSTRPELRSTRVVVELKGTRTEVPVQRADVTEPRIGNAVLQRYLVMIDFRERIVALWPDARLLRRRDANDSPDASKVDSAAAVVSDRERPTNAVGFD